MDLPKFQQWQAKAPHDYGGCGEVFYAEDEAGKAVALKCLNDSEKAADETRI